jgi:3-methyladenine DNA glycosylase AlkD
MKAPSRSSSTPTKRSDSRDARKSTTRWTKAAILRELAGLADRKVRAKMAYFGVVVPKAHGISSPVLHQLARHIGKNHRLARQLWTSGIHEARILAALIGESEKVTAAEMDRWARDFNSWDVVDSTCCYLYSGSKHAWKKAAAWSCHREEFIKRAGFSLVAYLTYKDKTAPDARFMTFLRAIEREAHDERHFVKKAVNWALRNIGKRNRRLNREAIRCAQKIRAPGTSPARWIAADALRELQSPAVQRRLQRKTS